MKALILFITLICLFTACERDADIELPETDPKMAITCFISPGKEIEAGILKVVPLYNASPVNAPEYISDARVGFSNGSDTVFLKYGPDNKYIDTAKTIPVLAGQKYYLFATAPGMPDISASCTVPLNQVSAYHFSYTNEISGIDTQFNLSMKWIDIDGEENYYRIGAERVDTSTTGNQTLKGFSFGTAYYNDFGRDGDTIRTGVGTLTGNAVQTASRWLIVYFITCDEHYFRYHLSLESYSSNNPFLDPSSLYTNVSGGIGCFGAYLQQTDKNKLF